MGSPNGIHAVNIYAGTRDTPTYFGCFLAIVLKLVDVVLPTEGIFVCAKKNSIPFIEAPNEKNIVCTVEQ